MAMRYSYLIVFWGLICFSGNAQQHSLRFAAGVGIGQQDIFYDAKYESINAKDHEYSLKANPARMGSHTNINISYNYVGKKNIGLQFLIDIKRGWGDNYFTNHIETYDDGTKVFANTEGKTKIHQHFISPMLYFRSNEMKSIRLYGSVGPSIGRAKMISVGTTNYPNAGKASFEWQTNYETIIGLMGTGGILVEGEGVNLFAEIKFSAANFIPSSFTRVKNSFEGIDNLHELENNHIEFKNSKAPNEQTNLFTSYNLNSIGLNLGLSFYL